ncbi:hypothetical protein JS756_09895 [Streptomyces actuosus]|uniref:Uncharacterized protein n=1 Tax=Streptomyces actuosus TaxID=1885 RepID=A0ABS2VMZ5_STRAS|nr:hypothetical protein [Streptomyces actuosus]MBN0044419.1 hypothetical protein [Streptomyces actuosus]
MTAPAPTAGLGRPRPFNAGEEGQFQLYGSPEPGRMPPRNFTSHLSGWAPGSKESRHWADNDYTEIKFTGCSMVGTTGRSVGVKLWQAIPFARDKDMGMKTFTNCFKGSTKTSRGEWSAHYTGGDNRYFTIPALNGSIYTKANLNVKKVYVDTTKAD